MKFHFDSSQEHQLRAINAVQSLFAGQDRWLSAPSMAAGAGLLMPTIPICANAPDLSNDKLLRNLQAVQKLQNGQRMREVSFKGRRGIRKWITRRRIQRESCNAELERGRRAETDGEAKQRFVQ